MISQHVANTLVGPGGFLNPIGIVVVGDTFAVVELVVGCHIQRNGLGSFGFVLVLLLLVLVVARHEQLHAARLAEGCTEHEEGDKKHKHIHHRGEVNANVDFLLFAFFFLCHYYSPPIFSM